jgi:hypothetical protein
VVHSAVVTSRLGGNHRRDDPLQLGHRESLSVHSIHGVPKSVARVRDSGWTTDRIPYAKHRADGCCNSMPSLYFQVSDLESFALGALTHSFLNPQLTAHSQPSLPVESSVGTNSQ